MRLFLEGGWSCIPIRKAPQNQVPEIEQADRELREGVFPTPPTYRKGDPGWTEETLN